MNPDAVPRALDIRKSLRYNTLQFFKAPHFKHQNSPKTKDSLSNSY